MATERLSILVVDDDLAHRTMLRSLLSGWGYQVIEADDGQTAIDLVGQRPFDLILMDVRMVKVSGLEALAVIKKYNPSIPVIIITAYSSVESAVEAMKNGAYDYLTKPLDFDELRINLQRAMEHRQLKKENLQLRATLDGRFERAQLIGNSPAITSLLDTVSQVAPSEASVLIQGESGTGKELVAAAIYRNSARRAGPFISLNCAAITETLFESELFGHEKGAFTGAYRRTDGRFQQADGGTLFLDEISEMPLTMQVKLLRVLQERQVTRVGGSQEFKIDVRLIAATNRDLAQEIAAGRFREDLYYRLAVVTLELPPLRARRDDIPLLADHFIRKFGKQNHKALKGLTPQAMDRLLKYDWPGNVRELMNGLERATVLARSEYIEVADLPLSVQKVAGEDAPPMASVPGQPLEEVEKAAVLQTLEACGGNKSEAARRLGVTRKTLHKKLKKYGEIKE
ncbi:MAG: sigma-54 dependent transcriptional regulator [Desulfobulbaceae bacterium]|nr:sigma-54 dependent transcriptional regulator [Desulfobulbaceae bacterium]